MQTAALAEQLRQRLTPRRRRQGLILLGLFAVYSVLGLLAVPGLVLSQARSFVAEKLHLELGIDKLTFNPWLLAVRIEGLTLREPGASGETLVAARSIYVNAQLWSSLWLRGASLAELDLGQPYVNARIRKDGSINLMQLLPPEDPEDTGEANWRIGQLSVREGRIAFHDDTRPTPFATEFQPLNLSLSGIASRPDRDGLYTLHAETGDGEALDWKGSLAMQPVRSEGELRITGLRATTPWRYLQDELPVVVEDGSIGISSHYRLTVDNGLAFSLSGGRVLVEGLTLKQRGENPLVIALGKLDLNGIALDWPQQTAGFAGLALRDFAISDPVAGRRLLAFGRLDLADGRYRPEGQRASLREIALADLELTDREQPALLALPRLVLSDLGIGVEARTAHVERIVLQRGALSVVREKNGQLNWDRELDLLSRRLASAMPPDAAAAPPSPAPATASAKPGKPAPPVVEKPWEPSLGELDLQDFRVAIADRVPATPFATSLEGITLRLLPRQKAGEPHALEGRLDIGTGGTLALKGQFTEQPMSVVTDLDLKGLMLPPFAPYFTDVARFALEDGALDVAGRFSFAQSPRQAASFSGQVAISNFAANDLDQDERFLAWKRLAASGIDWRLAPSRLVIRDIEADKPFMRLIIGADKTLNLSRVIVSDPDAETAATVTPVAATKPGPEAAPYPLRVDRIRIRNGAMLFADFTLKPQFATGIQSLTGTITGISSDAAARATVDLKGRVDQYGKADISGALNPLSSDHYTDMKVRFSDLELTTMTPYSAKFAGYRIDKGKLDLDLGYKISDRQLEATNKIVFNQLTLGEKVDSPEATSLPLKLAVAILKDKDGVIDIDLPLTGSLDDPQFRVAPLVWKAFVNLLTKAATAPFAMIAGMVGGGDDMDSLAFLPGQSDLGPENADKLDKLARALADRPALGVELRGAFDPQADALALRSAHFEAAYQKRLAEGGKPRKVLEAMFTEKLGSEALARQRALNLKPVEGSSGQASLQLAEEAYMTALRNELAARETVLEGDLRQLALERAKALRARLVEVNAIDAARIFVLEPVTATAVDGKVVLKVALSAS